MSNTLLWVLGGGLALWFATEYIRSREQEPSFLNSGESPRYLPASASMFAAPSAVDSGKITRLGPVDQRMVQLMTRQVSF